MVLVIVGDGDLVGVMIMPQKYNSPLWVDADAVEVFQVTGEFFEAIAWRNPEMVEFGCRMKLIELHFGAMLNLVGKFTGWHQSEYLCGFDIGKALDHAE